MNAEKWFQDELETVCKTFEYRLEKILIQLGEDICRLMREQQVSRAEVAERLGVSRAYVTKVLNGNPNLTIKTLLKLSDALGRELAIRFVTKPDRKEGFRAAQGYWTSKAKKKGVITERDLRKYLAAR